MATQGVGFSKYEQGGGRVLALLMVALVGAAVFGWSKYGPIVVAKSSSERLYRFTDSSGKMQYVDSLDKVPAHLREAAAAQPDVARINRADFNEFTNGVLNKNKAAAKGKS